MKSLFAALIIGTVSAVSMTWLFNNAPGTNNKLAATSAAITAVTYLLLNELEVA